MISTVGLVALLVVSCFVLFSILMYIGVIDMKEDVLRLELGGRWMALKNTPERSVTKFLEKSRYSTKILKKLKHAEPAAQKKSGKLAKQIREVRNVYEKNAVIFENITKEHHKMKPEDEKKLNEIITKTYQNISMFLTNEFALNATAGKTWPNFHLKAKKNKRKLH